MQTTAKVLDILDLFLKLNKDELSFSEIIIGSGLKRATAYRIINTLINRNFLKKQRKAGHYTLGIRLLELTHNIYGKEKETRSNGISYLVELSALINASVFIQIWYGSEVLFSKALNSSQKIPQDWIGMPLHQTCVGKIALANLSQEDFKRYFKREELSKSTYKTIIDIDKMKKDLATVKLDGVAFEEGERILHMSGIAAGIKNSYGETIGAVFLLADSKRFTHEVLCKLVNSLKIGAENISRELGYKF
jgi:DNA-binding IclR family transcriptional regulator